MKNKTISIPEEIFEKLKNIDNASQLISELLHKYFREYFSDPEDLEKEIGKIQETKKDFLTELEEREKKLKSKIEIKEKKIATIVKKQKLTEEKKREQEENIKKTFRDFMKREMSDLEFQEYLDMEKRNIFKFLELKGYVFEDENKS